MASVHVVQGADRGTLKTKLGLSGVLARHEAITVLETELKHGQPPYQSLDEFISELVEILLSFDDCQDVVVDAELAQRAVDVLRQRRRDSQSTPRPDVIIRNTVGETGGRPAAETNLKHHYQQLVKWLKTLPAFNSGQFSLSTVDDLNTYESSLELRCVLLAMVRQDPTRIMQFTVEDPTGRIPVQFGPDTNWREWATLQNGIYLLEGTYEGKRDSFLVSSIGLPPPVQTALPPPTPMAQSDGEDDEADSMIILVADVHLDDPDTMEALKLLLTGYDSLSAVPDLIVFMGDFLSQPNMPKSEFKDYMKNLVRLICTCKRLIRDSRFVLVPGPNDPTSSTELFVKNPFDQNHFPTTADRLRSYNLPSNPFHLQFRNRNLCLFGNRLLEIYLKQVINAKDDLLKAGTNQPDTVDKLIGSVARLVVANGHLTAGLNRNYITALSLLPTIPDMVIMADPALKQLYQCQPYETMSGATVATLTSFSRNGFQFLVYYPKTNQVEESQISL